MIGNEPVTPIIRSGEYKIENAKISDITLSMADHGCLTFVLYLKGSGWVQGYGKFAIGHGCLNADQWDGNGSGLVAMMKVMDVVGVERWEDLKSQYCRIKTSKTGNKIYAIGNILKDEWFDVGAFLSAAELGNPGHYYFDERTNDDDDDDYHGTAYPD